MKKVLFCLLVVLVLGNGTHLWEEKLNVDFTNTKMLKEAFSDWMETFDITYKPEEESYKFLTWIDKWREIVKFNNEKHSWDKKINQFSAMSTEEFTETMLGCGWKPKNAPNASIIIDRPNPGYPSSVDWRTKGVVTPVKNQGQCGSCWAFSTVASTECNYAIATGQLNSLSEQELVDCDTSCDGCGGGWQAFNWVIQNGGLCSESEYPYQGQDGTCQKSSCGTKYNPITGSVTVTPDSETALLQATAKGCVSVYVDAAASAWQDYSSGVLTAYCPDQTDHVVCVVGYGTSNGDDYWLIKNSWGSSWGMGGYINLCRGSSCQSQQSDGECGVLSGPGYPTYNGR